MLYFEDIIDCQPMYPDYLGQMTAADEAELKKEWLSYQDYYCVALDGNHAYVLKIDKSKKEVDHVLVWNVADALDFQLKYGIPLGSNPQCYQVHCQGRKVTDTDYSRLLEMFEIPFGIYYSYPVLEYYPIPEYVHSLPDCLFAGLAEEAEHYDEIMDDGRRRGLMSRFLYLWAQNIRKVAETTGYGLADSRQRIVMRDILHADKVHCFQGDSKDRKGGIQQVCEENGIVYRGNLEQSLRSVCHQQNIPINRHC